MKEVLCAFVCLLTPALALAPWLLRQERMRHQARRELAKRLGLEFSAKDPYRLYQRYDLRAFRVGGWLRIENVISGTYRGHAVCCFDLLSSGPGAEGGLMPSPTVILIRTPASAADLYIRPELEEDVAMAALGYEDVDFESEVFSRIYYVECSDRRLAHDILHPRAIELLLSTDRLIIEGDGDALLFRASGPGLLDSEMELPALLDLACEFVNMMPEYLHDGAGGAK